MDIRKRRVCKLELNCGGNSTDTLRAILVLWEILLLLKRTLSVFVMITCYLTFSIKVLYSFNKCLLILLRVDFAYSIFQLVIGSFY